MATSSTRANQSSEPLYFWREFEEPYGFMSQWYDSPFEVNGVTYASTEMWMMIQKAKLFGDEVYHVIFTFTHFDRAGKVTATNKLTHPRRKQPRK